MNNITSEIFKKKEVRQTQKRGKNKVWWDLRGSSDLFCWGAWGAWGQGKVLEMRGPQRGHGKGAGREIGTGGQLGSPHISRA